MSTSGEDSSTEGTQKQRADKLSKMWDIAVSFEEHSENEEIAKLGTLLIHFLNENTHLRRRVGDLEDRLSELERREGLSGEDEITVESPSFDRRDKTVLEVFAERNPETVHITELKDVYRKKTDVRRKQTLRERVSNLVENGPFEETSKMQRWKYVGE